MSKIKEFSFTGLAALANLHPLSNGFLEMRCKRGFVQQSWRKGQVAMIEVLLLVL